MLKSTYISSLLWITIGLLAISLVESGPVDENEIKKGRECKAFCGSCGCIGFYCGEECICECNEEKNDDTECIASIQARAKKDRVPFEILIQGPSRNRFLKNALQFDQNQKQCSKGDTGRSKRSTVVIYKPAVENALDANGYCQKPLDKDAERKQFFRGKRAVDVDSWFTDFSNTLVKPAPLRGPMNLPMDITHEVVDAEENYDSARDSAADSDETEFLPKIRGRIRNALKEKPITKAVKKIKDKALKAAELEKPVKKFRGAISSLRNRAEEVLLSSDEQPEPAVDDSNPAKLTTGRKLLNKLRGRIHRYFADDDGIIS